MNRTVAAAPAEPRAARLLAVEAAKQYRRPRTAAVIAAATAVEIGVCALVATAGGGPERLGDWGSVLPGSTGFSLPLVALNAMTLLAFPVIASVYAGDSIAGEAGYGTLRYLAARPVARWRIFASKAVTSALLTVATIAVAFVAALVFGVSAYGWHPLTVVDLQHSNAFHLSGAAFAPGSALLRSSGVLGVVLVACASTFAFSLLLSTVTAQSFAAVAGGIGFAFVSRALDNVPGLQSLSPWLPVTDAGTTAWTGLLTQPVRAGPIQHLLVVQAVYSGVFVALAVLRFGRSDLLS